MKKVLIAISCGTLAPALLAGPAAALQLAGTAGTNEPGSRSSVTQPPAPAVELTDTSLPGVVGRGDFAHTVVGIGDIDGDGIGDLAIGSSQGVGFSGLGSVWVALQNADGTVKSARKIEASSKGAGLSIQPQDGFGDAIAALGDLDGDGVGDLAVGAPADDTGGFMRGALWIVFLNEDGSAKGSQKISIEDGGFGGTLDDGDQFGSSLSLLGDLEGNGTIELAVGAPGDDDGTPDQGALWILSLQTTGSVAKNSKISTTQGGFPRLTGGGLGVALATIGDVNGDNVPDLATGTSDGVWIVMMNADGTVMGTQKIDALTGGGPANGGAFGHSVASLGDVDGNGIGDLAVTSQVHALEREIWVLFLQSGGTVASFQNIKVDAGGFAGLLRVGEIFAESIGTLDDLDGNGVRELAIGTPAATGALETGRVWTAFLANDGSVIGEQPIGPGEGGFEAPRAPDCQDQFGHSMTLLGDVDRNGVPDYAIGSPGEPYGADDGAVWILFMESAVRVHQVARIDGQAGSLGTVLPSGARFGASLTSIADIDQDGRRELLVGAPNAQGNKGSAFVLFLDERAGVKRFVEIAEGSGGFPGSIGGGDAFGTSVHGIGDLDKDGLREIAIGAPGHKKGGAVWVLTLAQDGTVATATEITEGKGGFGGKLEKKDKFGISVSPLGDVDGDGITELAVGASGSDVGGNGRGAVWILSLTASGTVKSESTIDSVSGGFGGAIANGDAFGTSLGSVRDLDGNGIRELLVGAPRADRVVLNEGVAWLLYLDPAGNVTSELEIGLPAPSGSPIFERGFGNGIISLSGRERRELPDFAIGANGDGICAFGSASFLISFKRLTAQPAPTPAPTGRLRTLSPRR